MKDLLAWFGLKGFPFDKNLKTQDVLETEPFKEATARLDYIKRRGGILLLTGEDQDEGVVGVHLEVSEQSEFFQGAGLEKMGLIDDEEDGLSRTLSGFQKGFLDLTIDGALGEPRRETEDAV